MAKTILIVEDDVLSMILFNDILQKQGYETVQSTDGSDFLDIVNERRPDLIIMDIQLPKRSGLELIKELKADEQLKNIPVIALTAHAMKRFEKKIRDAGFDDHITKPISVPLFIEMVAKHLS